MYSKVVDVSEIAKRYNGGGHKGASGFQSKELPFKKL
jgi:nanoRNase/pAp phosphatase (c-di-AMP/oligoRNAs hydrolase)